MSTALKQEDEPRAPRPWDGYIPEEELAVYREAGFGQEVGIGERPALLVIDVQYRSTGRTPAPLPDALKERASTMANGDMAEALGMQIEAVPAHNTTEDRMQYHPEGRDNGYVLTIGGKRFYIAGDTEPTPEMQALTDIAVAFLPMNLPYTMTVQQAADAVAAFKPAVVFPYHHRGSDIQEFAQLVLDGGSGSEVVIANWYPDGEA